jgi:hypothetical protein
MWLTEIIGAFDAKEEPPRLDRFAKDKANRNTPCKKRIRSGTLLPPLIQSNRNEKLNMI